MPSYLGTSDYYFTKGFTSQATKAADRPLIIDIFKFRMIMMVSAVYLTDNLNFSPA